ncbi:hypothetical protein CBX59_001855 [Salmonella enterica]|nr:hypothetical protein [Salmonella enterica]
MTTKFIYDIKEIMTEAWETARRLNDYNPEKYPTVKAAFAVALHRAWEHAKGFMECAIEDAKVKASCLRRGQRYLELLEIAERDGLSHGKSWIQNEMSMYHGGQAVCYVYPN